MNKNSKFALSFLACLTLAVGALVVASRNTESFSKINADPYTITIDDCSLLSTEDGVPNSSGYKIKYNHDYLNDGVLQADRGFFNETAITGIQSVSIDSTAQITIYPATCNGGEEDYITPDYSEGVTGTGTVLAAFSYEPDYFCISAGENNASLSNLEIKYSCKELVKSDFTIRLKSVGTSLGNVKLIYDVNYATKKQLLVDPVYIEGNLSYYTANSNATSVSMNSVSDYYEYKFEDIRFEYIRFGFVNESENRFIFAQAGGNPYGYFAKSDSIIYCTANGFPSTTARTTAFSTSSKEFGSGTLKTIDIYASNDFHGYVDETANNAGLVKFGSYFNEKGKLTNTLLLDQGDTWQGSFNSNYNFGNMVTDVMNYAHFDARTVGNHDFDWKADKVIENNARKYPVDDPEGYRTPALGSNICAYDFANKDFVTPEVRRTDIGGDPIWYDLENGLRVGIVGVIGEDQITSINSLYMEQIGFKDHVKAIKDGANYLRTEKNCDIVICSIHGGQENVMGKELSNYVDLVLCSHTHRIEFGNEGDLFYLQFGRNGENFGHVTLTYDTETKKIGTSYRIIPASEVKAATVDTTIQGIYDSYVVDQNYADVSAEVLHLNPTDYFASDAQLPRFACKAAYEYAMETLSSSQKEGLIGALTNYGRTYITGTWTYSDVYAAFPFENDMYIVETDGAELMNELSHNFYYLDSGFTLDTSKTYKILVNDYVLFHTSTQREYNYFPHAAPTIDTTDPNTHLNLNLREVIASYLRSHGYKDGTATLDINDYSETSPHHSFSAVTCNVTFTVEGEADVIKSIPYDAMWASYLPATPSKVGKKFIGWYRGESFVQPYSNCQDSQTLTAHFADFNEELDEFTFNYAELGGAAASRTLSSTDGTKTISATLDYTSVTDSPSYKNITVTSQNGRIQVSVPNNYIISRLSVFKKNAYDTLSFYNGESINAENKIDASLSGGDLGRYYLTPNAQKCLIANETKSNAYVYSIIVGVEKYVQTFGPFDFDFDVLNGVESAEKTLTVETFEVSATGSATGLHSDTNYSNFMFDASANAYIEFKAPSGYVIYSFKAVFKFNHNNFIFLAGNHSTGVEVGHDFIAQGGDFYESNATVNNNICTITNPTAYNTYLVEVILYIAAA